MIETIYVIHNLIFKVHMYLVFIALVATSAASKLNNLTTFFSSLGLRGHCKVSLFLSIFYPFFFYLLWSIRIRQRSFGQSWLYFSLCFQKERLKWEKCSIYFMVWCRTSTVFLWTSITTFDHKKIISNICTKVS